MLNERPAAHFPGSKKFQNIVGHTVRSEMDNQYEMPNHTFGKIRKHLVRVIAGNRMRMNGDVSLRLLRDAYHLAAAEGLN